MLWQQPNPNCLEQRWPSWGFNLSSESPIKFNRVFAKGIESQAHSSQTEKSRMKEDKHKNLYSWDEISERNTHGSKRLLIRFINSSHLLVWLRKIVHYHNVQVLLKVVNKYVCRGVRPFGVSLLIAGYDDHCPQLYQVLNTFTHQFNLL